MNKRIREIAEQAFQPINDISTEGVADRYTFEQSWFQMYNQKFSQLIVQEMLGLLEQYSQDSFPEDTIDDFDKGYLAGLYTARNAVKKHFGVE